MVVSRTEKGLDKSQHPSMTKTSLKFKYRRNSPQCKKGYAICDKPKANIILNREKLKLFPLRSSTRQRCPLSPLILHIILEVLAKALS
jgi:hypothetical protein